jgi:hypothetical protein
MCCIIAVTAHHHHTVLVHGATLILGVVRCGGGIMIMILIHHVIMGHLQHIQIHLYLIRTCTCPFTSQDIRYVDTPLVGITVTLNSTLEQVKGGVYLFSFFNLDARWG